MLTLHLVRHGQTACSRENRFCGSGTDVPLLPQGLAMAQALADHHAQDRWEAVFTSPLLRARQTGEPLARRAGIDLCVEEAFREISYGAWEGLMEDDIRARFPEEFAAWMKDPGQFPPTGGETGLDIAARVAPAVQAIRQLHPSGNVMVVSHKATIRVLVCVLLGIDVGLYRARIGQPVGAITTFEFRDQGPLLRVLGDTSYLPPDLRREATW